MINCTILNRFKVVKIFLSLPDEIFFMEKRVWGGGRNRKARRKIQGTL